MGKAWENIGYSVQTAGEEPYLRHFGVVRKSSLYLFIDRPELPVLVFPYYVVGHECFGVYFRIMTGTGIYGLVRLPGQAQGQVSREKRGK